jgi:transposase
METLTSAEAARSCAEAAAPVVLTANSLLRTRADLAQELHNAQLDLRFVADWDRMPEAVERIAADIVLVDMDAAEAASRDARGFSAHRLVSMLARQLAARATALVVITRLDYAEIEDLARAGITALIPPRLAPRALVEHLYAALAHVRQRRGSRVVYREPPTVAPEPPASQPPEPAESRPEEPAKPKRLEPTLDDGWRIPDSLWNTLALLLPAPSGRQRIFDRQVMDGLFLLLRTGAAPAALPPAFGSVGTLRRRLRAWQDAGVFERLPAVASGAYPRLRWDRLPVLLARSTAPAPTQPTHVF